MKTLQEIKDEYAEKKGFDAFDNWDDLVDYFVYWDFDELHNCIDDVMKEYAIEVAKEALRNASDNAELKESIRHSAIYDTIDKNSILDESNIPQL